VFEGQFDFIYRALRRHGVGAADAEDLAQEVFLVMWRRWAEYDPAGKLRTWLGAIAAAVAAEHDGSRVDAGLDDEEEVTRIVEGTTASGSRAVMLRALAGLPERKRALLVMHDLEGASMREIADVLSVPLSTAYGRLEGARRALRKAVARLETAASTDRKTTDAHAVPADIDRLPERPAPETRQRVLERVRELAFMPAPRRLRILEAFIAVIAGRGLALGVGALVAVALGLGAYLLLRRASVEEAPGPAAVSEAPAAEPAIIAPPELPAAPAAPIAVAALSIGGQRQPARAGAVTARASGSPALARGLLGYWSFDDGFGPLARDRSSHGAACLLRRLDATRDWVEGSLGGAINLTGRGWLECSLPRAPGAQAGASGELTVAAWIKRARARKGLRALVTRQAAGAARDDFFFGFADDDLVLSSDVWEGQVRRPFPQALGRWFHVAATRRADGTTKLFINGVEVGRGRARMTYVAPPADALVVGGAVRGAQAGAVDQRFEGVVDELAVYGRAVTDEEVDALAAGMQPQLPL
jgi:RNA polymerase sigma-70 factor (ECF subfamily)